jgi:hypothetical protein
MYIRPTPPRSAFAGELRAILDRGGHILIVYSSLEDYNYAGQFDDAFRWYGLTGRVTAEFLRDSNHTHTELVQQHRLAQLLTTWAEAHFPAPRPVQAQPNAREVG